MIAKTAISRGASPEQVGADLAREVLLRAAKRTRMKIEDLQRIPQGPGRRGIHDDISIIVVFMSK